MPHAQTPSPLRVLDTLCDRLDLTLVQRSGEIAHPTGKRIPMLFGYVVVEPYGEAGLALRVHHHDGSEEELIPLRSVPVFGTPGGRPPRFRTYLCCGAELDESGVRCGRSHRMAYRPPGGSWSCGSCARITWETRVRKSYRDRIARIVVRLCVWASKEPDIAVGGKRLQHLRSIARKLGVQEGAGGRE